jgi:membrane-bound ClpP family serine protease
MVKARLITAIVSTVLEETAIFLVWCWVLPNFGINLSAGVIAAVMAAWLVFSTSFFIFTSRVLRRQTIVGLPTMIGSRGRVTGSLDPEGLVKIKGEFWGATSVEGNIAAGEEVEVVGEEGLKLVVRRVSSARPRDISES